VVGAAVQKENQVGVVVVMANVKYDLVRLFNLARLRKRYLRELNNINGQENGLENTATMIVRRMTTILQAQAQSQHHPQTIILHNQSIFFVNWR
jgi:hypothetical protein